MTFLVPHLFIYSTIYSLIPHPVSTGIACYLAEIFHFCSCQTAEMLVQGYPTLRATQQRRKVQCLGNMELDLACNLPLASFVPYCKFSNELGFLCYSIRQLFVLALLLITVPKYEKSSTIQALLRCRICAPPLLPSKPRALYFLRSL